MTEPDVTFELAEKVAALTSEARSLRERLKDAYAESMRGSGLLTAMNDELRAENARLRGEVEIATRVYQESLGCIEWDGERIAALTADLARVTAERDGLRRELDWLLAARPAPAKEQ
jgi:uncharacterized small protein (DUF1192 family)